MKGNIKYSVHGKEMNLVYRYFPDTDEFELVRGEFADGREVFPSALKILETVIPSAEKIRDLIYLDLTTGSAVTHVNLCRVGW